MAERRMFAKTIIDSDAFIDMPMSARLLYYDLSMRADDDGFVNSPKKIMRMVGASQDDLSILILRKFIIPFDSGIVVIKHWRIHNYIRKDMYHETKYKDERATLSIDENNAYTQSDTIPLQPCNDVRNEPVTNPSTQDRLGKDSIGKDSIYIEFADGDEELLNALKDFEEMRKKKKKPLTDRARKMLCNRLKEFPRSEWIELLDQSIAHCWDTVYPLKKEGASSQSSSVLNDLRELHELFAGEDENE